MKVNLDANNKDKVIEFYYKKIKGTITIKYIDSETGKVIESKVLSDLELGEYEILPEDIKGYELIEDNEVKNEHIEKNEEDEDIEISNIDRLNAIKSFVRDLEEL